MKQDGLGEGVDDLPSTVQEQQFLPPHLLNRVVE